ncbi:unnamed protein product [Acanthocheilonema viteae]|uniref:Secreted protein n=1 Tax=Acanthocheilonema viteae TaxID=6277 RepID=A0A498SWK8_ACAVI|nr:unnamed protein product [Acanthocheilonema viteae]
MATWLVLVLLPSLWFEGKRIVVNEERAQQQLRKRDEKGAATSAYLQGYCRHATPPRLYARSAAATTTAAAAAAVFIATITSDRAVPSQINSQGGEFVLHRWVSSLMEETVPREQMN